MRFVAKAGLLRERSVREVPEDVVREELRVLRSRREQASCAGREEAHDDDTAEAGLQGQQQVGAAQG